MPLLQSDFLFCYLNNFLHIRMLLPLPLQKQNYKNIALKVFTVVSPLMQSEVTHLKLIQTL